MSRTHDHKPDPGRERAVELILEWFDDPRHRRDEAWIARHSGYEDGSGRNQIGQPARECLGCFYTGPGEPGQFTCTGGGPSVAGFCSACLAETGDGYIWRYRLSWERFYRLLGQREPLGGQLAMFA